MSDGSPGSSAGCHIPDPGFAGDDGAPDPVLAGALGEYGDDQGRHVHVFLALQHARLLVPLVAVLGEVEHDESGLAHDKTSDMPVSSEVEMATALLTGKDGRQALLAFSSLESLGRWRPDARPVPVTAMVAARSALQEGASALVVDVAGPTSYAVEGRLLEGLARGWTLAMGPDGPVWAQPAE